MRTRTCRESNYHAVFINGRTIRTAIDNEKPVLPLVYPEFMDVKLTNKCTFGQCSFCYMNSTPETEHTAGVVDRIYRFFEPIPKDLRPFQVAIGGGEPTEHPEFADALLAFHNLGILPNYTTNGTLTYSKTTQNLLWVTGEVCGGVAISAHQHLRHRWSQAVEMFSQSGVTLCLHHIISDNASVDRFLKEADIWGDKIAYHVLLPLSSTGRSRYKISATDYLFNRLHALPESKLGKCAFGALFFDDLVREKLPVSLYEPEAFSRFLDLTTMKCYASSFDLTEKPMPHWRQ